jgi:hypothetical protein
MCKRGGYDPEVGINELYLQDLKGVKNPSARMHSWIKRYLPKILAVLKKRRGEIQFDDGTLYISPVSNGIYDFNRIHFTPKEKTNG